MAKEDRAPGGSKFELPHKQHGGFSNRLTDAEMKQNASLATKHAEILSARAESEGTRGAHNRAKFAQMQAFDAHARLLEHGQNLSPADRAAAEAGRHAAAKGSNAHGEKAKTAPRAEATKPSVKAWAKGEGEKTKAGSGSTKGAAPASPAKSADRERAVRQTYTGAYGEPAKTPSSRDVAEHRQRAQTASDHANVNGKPAAHEQAAGSHRSAAIVSRDAARAWREAGHDKIAAKHERDAKAHDAIAKMHEAIAAKHGGGGSDEFNRDEQGRFASK